jgi:hypothetical protein
VRVADHHRDYLACVSGLECDRSRLTPAEAGTITSVSKKALR